MVKVTPRHRPSSAPAPPQGAPGSSGWLGAPREETSPLGAQPLPRVLELATSKAADFTAFDHSGVSFPWGLMLSPKAAPGLSAEAGLSAQTDSVADALAASEQIGGDDEWDPDSEIWIP